MKNMPETRDKTLM